jgi:PAS domain-containing protein
VTPVIDLTERKKAEEELRQSEGRYGAVVEQAAGDILLFDVDCTRL